MKLIRYWWWLWCQRHYWWMRALPKEEREAMLICGLPGSGKTSYGTMLAIMAMRDGLELYSNIRIVDPYTGRSSRPVTSWIEVMECAVEAVEQGRHILFYFAELQNMADSREWMNAPTWFLELMAERRHYGINILADTQHYEQVDKRLRLLIGRVVIIEPHFLRRLWSRLPIFYTWRVNNAFDVELYSELSKQKPRLLWIPSFGFFGHHSAEITNVEKLGKDVYHERAALLKERLRRVYLGRTIETFGSDTT